MSYSISVIIVTARGDYPIIGLPNTFIFEPTFRSLEKQTFKDFEVVVVDALYPRRRWFMERRFSFPVKYVPPHAGHRFWLDRGLWSVCGMLNTALLHVEGELILRLDDCCEIPDPNFLKRVWEFYQSGYFPMAMHVRYHAGKPARVSNEYLKHGYEARYAIMPVSYTHLTLPTN